MKCTAFGELTPDPFPQLANGTGPNRTRAQWKITNVITSADALVNNDYLLCVNYINIFNFPI